MHQRIVIAGMKRTGSTWLYNATRLLCEADAPGAVWAGGWDAYLTHKDQADIARYCIVKRHEYNPWLAEGSIVITSFRPLAEIRRSYETFAQEPLTDALLTMWMTWLMEWSTTAALYVWYPWLALDPRRVLRQLADVLEIAPTLERIVHGLNTLIPPDETYDPVTCLFPHHCTSGEWITA